MNDCPRCGSTTEKVIFVGAPGRLCMNRECSALTGLAAHMPPIGGPNGFVFMVYEGSYWRALWDWLFGRDEPPHGGIAA